MSRWLPAVKASMSVTPATVLLVGLLVGCGASEAVSVTPGVDLDGDYLIVEVVTADGPIEMVTGASMAIDSVDGRLMVTAGCNTLFGSMSLGGDGSASFTVPGTTGNECPPAVTAQEEAISEVLAVIDSWARTDEGLVFSSPGGAGLTLE